MMIGWDCMKWEVIEDVCIIVGLVWVQFLYAGNSILLSYLLKLGFEASSLIIFSNFATFLVLFPLSFIFERRQWPKRISCRLLIKLLLLSFGGVTVFQSLFMEGVHLTSPAMATAMPNLAPGLIFLIAWTFRLEKVQVRCRYSRAKIGGTLLCVSGAVVMSLMQSSTVHDTIAKEASLSPSSSSDIAFDRQIIIGSMYLIAAVLVLSIQVVLQAITLRDFPAPISLCATISLVGALITSILQFVEDHTWDPVWSQLTIQEMFAYSILAGSVSGMCVSFNAWAMKRRGPVMVSIFNPLGTVISTMFSVITFGEFICLGSLAGMCLMFIGLYTVLWAKRREEFSISTENMYDVEKPLLS